MVFNQMAAAMNKKWKVNHWLFAWLRRELSLVAMHNMNWVVAMPWMKQRHYLMKQLGTWTTEN